MTIFYSDKWNEIVTGNLGDYTPNPFVPAQFARVNAYLKTMIALRVIALIINFFKVTFNILSYVFGMMSTT